MFVCIFPLRVYLSMLIYNFCVQVKVSKAQTHRAAQLVPGGGKGDLSRVGVLVIYIRKTWPLTIVDNVLVKWHDNLHTKDLLCGFRKS